MKRTEWLREVAFFSSRRRHTRFDCDWSSDVCSSDLVCPDGRRHGITHRFDLVLEPGGLERPATRRRPTQGQTLHQRRAAEDGRALLAIAPRDLREQLLQTTAGHGIVEREVRPAEKRR